MLEHAPVLADDDALLGGPLDDDAGLDERRAVWTVREVLHDHGRRVGQFLAHGQEQVLADDFSHEEPLRLVREHVGGVERRARGEHADHGGQQRLKSVSL